MPIIQENSFDKIKRINIRSPQMAENITMLDNCIRAEYNNKRNFLEYYAGKNNLRNVNTVKNQIIYGRRGTGKTHLLKALQEQILLNYENRSFAVYIDMRKCIPIMEGVDALHYSIILFRETCIEIMRCAYESVPYLFGINELDYSNKHVINSKKTKVMEFLSRLYASLNNKDVACIEKINMDFQETQNSDLSFSISLNPTAEGCEKNSKKTTIHEKRIKYISMSEMTSVFEEFLLFINIDKVYLLIDEWSEIPLEVQPYLSEMFKRSFVHNNVVLKIAAITNRTRLMQNHLGLEDGGDIFGYSLDYSYIYELDSKATKFFFNELLYNQLGMVNSVLPSRLRIPLRNDQAMLGLFFSNQAMREILVASAGIPRDFLNIFISAYKCFIGRDSEKDHISLNDVRTAAINWYDIDKRKAVAANESARIMLDMIVNEVIIGKRRCHFILPEKYETHEVLNDLIDMRVVHLRRRGVSYKADKLASYNVYYIDYSCYSNSSNHGNQLNKRLLEELDTDEDLRDVWKVSLDDKFFDILNTELGYGFKCPHCGYIVDTRHPAYIKQNLCNKCFEKVDS